MAVCKIDVQEEYAPGIASTEFRVTCKAHGVIDKTRTLKDVEIVWEKHQNNVKVGLAFAHYQKGQ